MRTVELDPTVIGAMPPEGHARQWRTLLLSSNLLVDLGERQPKENPAVQTLRAIQASYATLPELQDEISRVSKPLGWTVGEVPNPVWGVLATVFVALLWISNNLLVAMCGAPVLLMPFAVVGLIAAGLLEVNRRKLVEARSNDLLENRGELSGLVRALLERDFVTRVNDDLTLVCSPSRMWLLNRCTENRTLPLEGYLREEYRALDERIQGLVEAGVGFEALEVDLGPIRQRLEEAERSIRLHPELDGVLRAAGSEEP